MTRIHKFKNSTKAKECYSEFRDYKFHFTAHTNRSILLLPYEQKSELAKSSEILIFHGNVILPFIDRIMYDTELYRIIANSLGEQVTK